LYWLETVTRISFFPTYVLIFFDVSALLERASCHNLGSLGISVDERKILLMAEGLAKSFLSPAPRDPVSFFSTGDLFLVVVTVIYNRSEM